MIIKLDARGTNEDEVVTEVCDALKRGEVAILPTDTVYGLAAVAFKTDSLAGMSAGQEPTPWREPISKLYALKGRPSSKPALLLTDDWERVRSIAAGQIDAAAAFHKSATHPVTVILPARWVWPEPFTVEGRVAIRVIGQRPRVTFKVVQELKFIFSVSANEPGFLDPNDLTAVPARFVENCAVAVDAGPTEATRPSWLVDFTGWPPVVRRGGAAAQDALASFVKSYGTRHIPND